MDMWRVVLTIESWVSLALGVGMLACEVWALVDCLRQRPEAFEAAGKRTRTFWLVVLGLALVVGLVFVRDVLGLLGVAAFLAAAVYLADVRPSLNSLVNYRGTGRRA